jgi:predicted O-methyltransferase YrrM
MSTLYFAAAMRDNSGGNVIGAELVLAKVVSARRNRADAGLADYAEIPGGLYPDRRLAAF